MINATGGKIPFQLEPELSEKVGVPTELWEKYKVTDYDTCVFLAYFKEEPGSKVLVVGAHDEPSANMLSDMNMEVIGVDLREYDRELPPANYKFIRGDFCNLDLSEYAPFDAAVALSCIEHFGMGTYKEGSRHRFYDVIAMRRIWELLKEGGRAYVTVPVCGWYNEVWPHWRTYDLSSIQERLVQDFYLLDLKGVVSGDVILPDGRRKKAGEGLTQEELNQLSGHPPHYSCLLIMEKVPICRMSPDGR